MIADFDPEFAFAFRSAGRSNGTDDCFRKCRLYSGTHAYMIKEDSTDVELIRITGLWQQLTLPEGE